MRASSEGREKTALARIRCLYRRVGREKKKIINAIKCGQINQMPQTNYENITGREFSITSNGV